MTQTSNELNSSNLLIKNTGSDTFDTSIERIFFQSLKEWNRNFLLLKKRKISEIQFRKYILSERKQFVDNIMKLFDDILEENKNYKQLIMEYSSFLVNCVEEKLNNKE